MTEFLQMIVSGIMTGAIYGLVALGFVIIYKSSGIFNFAIGAMVMFSAFLGYSMLVDFKLPIWLAVLVALLVMCIIAAVAQRLAIKPLIGQPILSIVMVTLGLFLVVQALAVFFWGHLGARGYPSDIMPFALWNIGGIVVTPQKLGALGSCLLVYIIFVLFFRYSRAGLQMRAVAEGHKLAESTGIRVNTVIRNSWIIAAVACAVGGIWIGIYQGVFLPISNIGLKGLPAALVGGLESIHGAMIGGFIIGIAESLLGGYIGGGISEVGAFLVLMLVLIIRPYGLFGLEKIERL